MISYKFKRTTHLYIGPPIASVTEIQYTRVEKDDTFLLASNVKIDGVPYADTFTVEYRWVGQKMDIGTTCLHVQVGVFVNFKKSSM